METRIAIEQPTEADLDIIHPLLAATYWATGIPRDVVARAASHSMCAIARDESGTLIGYARVVSDRATFAWVCDVLVVSQHRGQGVGRALVREFMQRPELQGLRRWMLGTKDAHGVYAALGFRPLDAPERYMLIRNPSPYGVVTT